MLIPIVYEIFLIECLNSLNELNVLILNNYA